ncbi:hypothetical protein [Grimontia hollisae]|uniref:Uncharacterized protein n=1 Tax=Grimontia hollisae TaxID=673 RepID=A0A377HMV3_GRIHO|nr:hypothetical protein [Grimontia hollisae]STO57558.1 Uncharacterised protein [Grimontia hollisae]STQ75384.1 Uncharacterised protein [Grimontia hollisae]
MGRRHRRRSHGSMMISDSVKITARLPWWGSVLFGLISFFVFYFGLPAFLESKISDLNGNPSSQALDSIFMRRIHWFEWLGIACGLIGAFFGIRNYFVSSQSGYEERGLVSILAKLISRNIN